MVLPQLRRVRWAVRATLVLGVAASVVANILHALDNPISQAIAAWPPLALLLTVELISRVPVHRRSLAFARLLATATIAGIAAWVSYWHMAGVAARYGETGASPYLLPLSVDGLIVVASICLVELGGRIAALEAAATATAREAAASAATVAARTAAPPVAARTGASPATVAAQAEAFPVPAYASPDTVGTPAEKGAAIPGLIPVPASASTSAPILPPAQANQAAQPARRLTAAALAEVAAALPKAGAGEGAELPSFKPTVTRQPRTAPASGGGRSSEGPSGNSTKSAAAGANKKGSAPKARRTPAETVALAARIKAERPDVTDTELAAALGISASRWRTVRREAAQSDDLRLAA
ncbi:MAG TPA: DUF2637 domain-containing protein [Actinoplanes sp.]|nr:DUF2637 domain-containing protein [Actinoplanes sp.]